MPLPDIAAVTGADGRYSITAPVPGRYVVTVAAAEHEPDRFAIEIPGDGTRIHRTTLRPAG